MEAITREEKIMSGENLTPITRKEMFLAKAAGMDVETPEPITREEMFLSKIGGGNVDGTIPEIDTASEMDEILANATTEDLGKIYRYMGTTTDIYENGAIYIIAEE